MLSNASLDIAFHDMNFIEQCSLVPFLSHTIKKNDSRKEIDDEYIKMFWVGLMEGDGSIQVNHWRKKSLQYRLIIKLSSLPSNYNMLIKIAKVIGGTVRKSGNFVIWVVDDKKKVQELIKIFDKYPLLSSKKNCQLAFLKKCLIENSMDFYLTNRDSKFEDQKGFINTMEESIENKTFTLPIHFHAWLSGFIDAEGCFSIRQSNNHSFSIGQNDDFYLLILIKQYFNIINKVRNTKANFYLLEIYKKEALKKILSHCTDFPLLGEKAESLKRFQTKL